MTKLRSLAHPEWPYIGTPHEWRGFAKLDDGRCFEDCSPECACNLRHAATYQKLKLDSWTETKLDLNRLTGHGQTKGIA